MPKKKKYGGGGTGKILAYMLVIGIVFSTLGLGGCAKDVGDDGVSDIATAVNIVSEGLTEEGLIALAKEDPFMADEMIGHLRIVIATGKLYGDGQVTVSDFVTTLNTALEQINNLTDKLDEDQAALIARTINRASRVLNEHINEFALPEEAGIYINATIGGIETGIMLYQGVE